MSRQAAGGRNTAAGVEGKLQPVIKVAQELRRWTDTVLGVAGGATDLSLNLIRSMARGPRQQAAVDKAGSLLRQARRAARMTTRELGAAIDISDPRMLELAERGKATLPFEIILRLAGILGRHDPISFALKLTRSYNPGLWKALEDLGIGNLVVHAGREREFVNVYRAHDAARQLSDREFAAVLRFVDAAFRLAVDLSGHAAPGREPAARARRKRPASARPAKKKPVSRRGASAAAA
jgi:hypothetical protein